MAAFPQIDPASALQCVVNAAAGSSDAKVNREIVEAALRAAGRRGDVLLCRPTELSSVSQQAAARAISTRTAVVAVGGDGTLNTVAQAAHTAGCAMGVVPQGTFDDFARTHGIPVDPTEAVRLLLRSAPVPGSGPGRWPLGRGRNHGVGGRPAPLEAGRWEGAECHEGCASPRCLIGIDPDTFKSEPQPPPASPRGGAGRDVSGWRGSPPSHHR